MNPPMTEVDVYDILTKELLFTYECWDVPRANDRISHGLLGDYIVIYTEFFAHLPNDVDIYVLPA